MRPAALSAFLPPSFFPPSRAAQPIMGDRHEFYGPRPQSRRGRCRAKQAEAFRKQSALEWLGKELPTATGEA